MITSSGGMSGWLRVNIVKVIATRLHSSRMRTSHLLPISPGIHCMEERGAWSWGVGAWFGEVGGAWSQGWVPGLGDAWSGAGCLVIGSICSQGGAWSQGGYLLLGWCIPACNGTDPPVNRITDTCKNITLPQLRCGR